MDIKELFAKQEEMKQKNLNAKNEKESEITKVMTFYIGDQVYGIEIPSVIEIIGVPHITVVPGIPYYIKGIINVRSKVVPVIDMRSRFGKPEREYTERTNTIIIEDSGVLHPVEIKKMARRIKARSRRLTYAVLCFYLTVFEIIRSTR